MDMPKTSDQREHNTQAEQSGRVFVFLQKPLVHILLIGIVCLLAYSNTFHVPFQWDEGAFIKDNPVVLDLHYYLEPWEAKGTPNYYSFKVRYVTYFTFALNYALHGYDVVGYHIVNLLIHFINGFLVYLLTVLLFKTPFLRESELRPQSGYIALFAGLLFVSHPVQTMAVTYIYQRLASFVAFFYLLSVVLYIKSRLEEGKLRYVFYLLSFFTAICAMKTKENAITLPLAIMLTEYFFFSGSVKRRFIGLIVLLLTILIIPVSNLLMMTKKTDVLQKVSSATRASFTMARDSYFYTQLKVLVIYLKLFFFPVNQSVIYDMPLSNSFFEPKVILSFILLLSIFSLGVYLFVLSKKREACG